jgi:threonine synthase
LSAVNQSYHYLLDPHGAVAYKSLKNYQQESAGESGYILETAHPIKFYDVVEPIINQFIEAPDEVKALLNEKKESILMMPVYGALKSYLMK